jgi:hypothetical protein
MPAYILLYHEYSFIRPFYYSPQLGLASQFLTNRRVIFGDSRPCGVYEYRVFKWHDSISSQL